MDLSFSSIINWTATYFFGGSSTLAGLSMLLGFWVVALILLINAKAPPQYSVVPMIPAAILFRSYGILDDTIMILIIIVSSVLVASSFKRMWD